MFHFLKINDRVSPQKLTLKEFGETLNVDPKSLDPKKI